VAGSPLASPLALRASDLTWLGIGSGEVLDDFWGLVTVHELVHGQAPDGAVRQVEAADCRLDSYLMQKVVNL